MDKNEELQKWLNDDKYIRPKDLMILLNMSRSRVDSWLASKKIKPIKSFHTSSFYDKKTCMQLAEYHFKIPRMIEEYSHDESYAESNQLVQKFGVCNGLIQNILRANKIKPTRFNLKGGGTRCFYDAQKAEIAISNYLNSPKHKECQEYLADKKYIEIKELSDIFNCNYNTISKAISSRHIKSVKRFIFGRFGAHTFYDRIECLRRLSDYSPRNTNNFSRIQSEAKQEVEQVEQNELPEIKHEPAETTPDIIPADTIDLFTMSELESELKQRGVELTAEVKAKINASDMPEMQHIATMLRGHAKTIAIRLSVLNEIANFLNNLGINKNDDEDVFYSYHQAAELLGISIGSLRNKVNAIGMVLHKKGVKAYFTINQIESLRKDSTTKEPSDEDNTISEKFSFILNKLEEIENQIAYHKHFDPIEDVISRFKSAIQSKSNVLSALLSRAKIVIHNESCVILLDQKFAADKVNESKNKEIINNALLDIGCKDFNIYVLFSGKCDVKK